MRTLEKYEPQRGLKLSNLYPLVDSPGHLPGDQRPTGGFSHTDPSIESNPARPDAHASRNITMPAQELHFGTTARSDIQRGVDKLANAVKITLGPRGRHVVLD